LQFSTIFCNERRFAPSGTYAKIENIDFLT